MSGELTASLKRGIPTVVINDLSIGHLSMVYWNYGDSQASIDIYCTFSILGEQNRDV